MYLLKNRSVFSVTSSQTRERTAQTGSRAAGICNRNFHGGPATLCLDHEWADEVCFSFLHWTQSTSGKLKTSNVLLRHASHFRQRLACVYLKNGTVNIERL